MKNRYKLLGIIIIVLCFFTQAQSQSIEKELFLMEGVIFKKIQTPKGYQSAYELMIRQPLDHKNPEAGSFFQRVFLSHVGRTAPNVLVTEGYDRPKNRLYELSQAMQANQIQVEHRFFGVSMPKTLDYSYLTLEQATADYHRIKELFSGLYTAPFVSTGISKGGMMTLFYRYFYPNDVAVSVPYVAPINVAFKDKRIYKFLDEVGTKDCRKKITAFQKLMLKNKSAYMPLIKWYAKGSRNTFEELSFEKAYELAVLEFSFSFWQYGADCEKIPSSSNSTEEILDYFLSVSGVDFFADKSVNGYASFYYQMGTEMGYYGYNTDDFKGLIDYVGDEPSAVFMPKNTNVTFNGDLTIKAQKYFTNKLEKVVYIYGEIDTWSATRINPKSKLDALSFVLKGKSHANARIKSMNEEQLLLLDQTMEKWTGMELPIKE